MPYFCSAPARAALGSIWSVRIQSFSLTATGTHKWTCRHKTASIVLGKTKFVQTLLTQPVLVFRLVASDTVEQEILKKAKAKRVLESVVIKKGKFRNPITHAEITEKNSADENGDLALATTKVDVQAGDDDEPLIGPTDLERLLDRSPEAYARTFGWQSTEGAQSGTGTQKHSDHALFEVTETSQQAANPTLARIFSGEVDHS